MLWESAENRHLRNLAAMRGTKCSPRHMDDVAAGTQPNSTHLTWGGRVLALAPVGKEMGEPRPQEPSESWAQSQSHIARPCACPSCSLLHGSLLTPRGCEGECKCCPRVFKVRCSETPVRGKQNPPNVPSQLPRTSDVMYKGAPALRS